MKIFAAVPRPRPARLILWMLAATAGLGAPGVVRASGGYDTVEVPTLPYYLDRLPAKPPSQVFVETAPDAPPNPPPPVDFGASVLALARDAEGGVAYAPLAAKVDGLLARARLDPAQPGPLCNLLNDARDLFTGTPAATGKDAADYLRWRVARADWFGLFLDPNKKPPANREDPDSETVRKAAVAHREEWEERAKAAPAALRVHWLYLGGALAFPDAGAAEFQQVVDGYPDHPRAESARFLLARMSLGAPDVAKAAFEAYLARYPGGRFVADTKGWLGGIAFRAKDYLGALNLYLEQADTPGHPEVLKSAGFMCERCLSHLSAEADDKALAEIAARPRLAMSLIYLVVNTPESDYYKGGPETPAQVRKWRLALLPRLAAQVAAHEAAYHAGGADWQARYLAILAQAASGVGDQTRALALCDLAAPGGLDRNDDLAFIRLVALQRARRLPEAVAAGRAFAARFPTSLLKRGAALRLALALQDGHQAGAALVELTRLVGPPVKPPAADEYPGRDEVGPTDHSRYDDDYPAVYPLADANLDATRSVLRRDATGAEYDQLNQLIDTLLCFAPPSEIVPALDAASRLEDGSVAMCWRAVLAQRRLGEEENFAEARQYATPAQWSLAAAGVEKLAAEAAAHPADAEALLRLADGWAAARGKLVFAPLETDATRGAVFADDAARAGLHRRENGATLGFPADTLDHALEGRDELRHAQRWWLRAADAAPMGSPLRARALWSALKATPGIALASPYQYARAVETGMEAAARQLYERLRQECPGSREAREFAVYYDFPSPTARTTDAATGEWSVSDPSTETDSIPNGEPEYLYSDNDAFDKGRDERQSGSPDADDPDAGLGTPLDRALALRKGEYTSNPKSMALEVAAIRRALRAPGFGRADTALLNLIDDVADLLGEDAAKLTPDALKHYLDLRFECLRVAGWHWEAGDSVPPVPGVDPEAVESADANPRRYGSDENAGPEKPLGGGKGVDDTVFNHIRAAYKAPGMAPLKDYLDFLALAVIANHRITVVAGPKSPEVPQYLDKDGQTTYTTRDYPKLEELAAGFLAEHPRSGKREAARLLYARALYNASRPTLFYKYAVWPESEHFAGANIIATHRREPFDSRKIGEALNAYDKEFPGGRYASEIRNLRALLAWRTQDWNIALDLTLSALDDPKAPDLQPEAARRLANIFSEGLCDETERARLLAAVKTRPAAVKRLREYLEKCDHPLRMIKSWVKSQLSGI